MTNIQGIIGKYRGQMESTGLLHRPEAVQLSAKVAVMPTSFTKARLALQEYSLSSVKVQESPMAMLFEYTLPKLEPLLIEIGEERAEQIVSKLCEHGKTMIKEHGAEGTREYLETLFQAIPQHEVRVRQEKGLNNIIEAYKKYYYGRKTDLDYLRIFFEDKIDIENNKSGTANEKGLDILIDGRVSSKDIYDSDLLLLGLMKTRKIRWLNLTHTQITDNGLKALEYFKTIRNLDIIATPIQGSGLIHLKNISIKHLNLERTGINDAGLIHLIDFNDLESINLSLTEITDSGLVEYISRIKKLKSLTFRHYSNVTKDGIDSFRKVRLWLSARGQIPSARTGVKIYYPSLGLF